MSRDILDAMANLRIAFIAANLNPPAVMLLDQPEDGLKLIQYLKAEDMLIFTPGEYGRPVEHPDGSVWMELDVGVVGMQVRWPARTYPQPNGGFKRQ